MWTLRFLVMLAPFGFSSAVYAKDGSSAHTVAMAPVVDVWQWVMALILVLAVFLIGVWVLRKAGGLGMANKGQLAILAGLSLGMREKLVLVKVGEKQLLLGISTGRIDKLLELEGDQRLFQPLGETQKEDAFERKLMQIMQGKNCE